MLMPDSYMYYLMITFTQHGLSHKLKTKVKLVKPIFQNNLGTLYQNFYKNILYFNPLHVHVYDIIIYKLWWCTWCCNQWLFCLVSLRSRTPSCSHSLSLLHEQVPAHLVYKPEKWNVTFKCLLANSIVFFNSIRCNQLRLLCQSNS